MRKKVLLILLAILVIIQFIRPAKNQSGGPVADDLTRHYPVPDSVLHILQRSCYDCHSGNTVYPWYNHIQPVAWWLRSHITHGKYRLNFSIFGSYPIDRQKDEFKAISREVKGGGMPLDSYLWIHKDAVLSQDEKSAIIRWSDQLHDSLSKLF